MTTRQGARLSTVVLVAVLVFVLAGLATADRALTRTDALQAELDASESAARVEAFLHAQSGALRGFYGVYLDATDRPATRPIRAIAGALDAKLVGFRSIWVTDSSGAVVEEHVFGASPAASPPGLDVDTLSALRMRTATRVARLSGRTTLSSPGRLLTGESGFYIVEPVVIDGRFRGFVGGSVTARTLRDVVVGRRARPQRVGLVVEARGDSTVVMEAPRQRRRTPVDTASATIAMPGGGITWQVHVMHASTSYSARLTLWLAGMLVLAFLLLAVVYERRQLFRSDERSRELERLSSELLRANRAKSEFLANVSHELRTPLNAIVGFVELLKDGVYGELGPRQVSPVDRIAVSATHLRHLVDQILDLARMTAGRLEVHPELVDLRPFVLDVVSEVESLVSEKGLHLSIGIGASLPRVRTDPAHLRAILVNLLGNAVKYTPQGGIAVRAKLVERPTAGVLAAGVVMSPLVTRPSASDAVAWVALQVADTGIGIARANHDRIFEEFEQVNPGSRGDSMSRGTGLGLAISRRLARLLGGDLTVDSEPGKGSTFTLWLPIGVREASQPRRTPAASGPALQEARRP